MFDNHIHSWFSGDSSMNPEDACRKAIDAGLKGIAFTDHLDISYPGPENFSIDFDSYSRIINTLTQKYSKKLKILKGIEIGIQPSVSIIEASAEIARSYDFDYIIGSIHVVDGEDPYRSDYYERKGQKQAYGRYLELILYMIENFEDFDMVGHFEYITRYCSYFDRTMRYSENQELFDEIFKALIKRGKGFEINTASFRERPGTGSIDIDKMLLKRYKELGGELICLASDAHKENDISYKFDYYYDLIRNSGFKYLVHYEKRIPVFDAL